MEQKSTSEWAINNIAGTYSNVSEATAKLKLAAQNCHLIGGAAITPNIEGHDVQITVIPINKADCYPIKAAKPKDGEPPPVPRKGIPKSTLMQIASAAGVEWDAPMRLDDGRDPHYCLFQVKGRYMTIDGNYRTIVGERDVDVRDGADQIAGKSEFAVQELRANMIRSAITKAKLRALRDAFGVSQGMPEPEIEKPFVFAKTVFTGRSDDPQARYLFAQVIAIKQLAASAALYGGAMPTLQLPSYEQPQPPRQLKARIIDCDENGEVIEPPPAPCHSPAPPPPPPRSSGRANGNGGGKAYTWPWNPNKDGDPAKGTPFKDCPTEALERLASYCEKKAAEGGQYADSDAAKAKAARAEIASRSAAPAPTTPQAPVAGDRGDNGDNW